jgi:phosphoenolpyruvate carboxykinase (GTP)
MMLVRSRVVLNLVCSSSSPTSLVAGKFMWPGFGDNARVLEWVLSRCDGAGAAIDTPIGFVPTVESLNVAGLKLAKHTVERLLLVDNAKWIAEVEAAKDFLQSLMNGDEETPVPSRFYSIIEDLKSELANDLP